MLGQELVREFCAPDFETIGWDKEDLDITNFEETAKKISEINPSILINSVAYNLVDKIEEDPNIFELAKNINGEQVGNIRPEFAKTIILLWSTILPIMFLKVIIVMAIKKMINWIR